MDNQMKMSIVVISGYVLWTIIIFFITRWFWLWYFKINKRTKTMEDIEQHLYDIKLLLQGKEIDEPNDDNEDGDEDGDEDDEPQKKWKTDFMAIKNLFNKE